MRRSLFLLPLVIAVSLSAQAQPADSSGGKTGPHKAARLFRSGDEPITMWLSADFKTVFKDRDSLSTKRYPASMRYLGEKGDTVSLDIELSTRGHFRLRICDFVPLKVYFKKEQTQGGPFGGEGSLKLGTHCRNNEGFVQNTYVEYAINRMYNLLTPLSLKARLATVTWMDPKNPKFTVTQPGIWFQDEDDLMKEVGGKIIMQQGATGAAMEPRLMAINDIFQYMIGNTDFSVWALHNYRVVAMDTSAAWYAFAYDFDWAGLVNAPYAAPDSMLSARYGIRRVTDRLYRSVVCYPPEVLNGTLDLFKNRKDSIYATLRNIKELTPERLKKAEEFLDKFYLGLDDPKQIRKTFEEPCRK